MEGTLQRHLLLAAALALYMVDFATLFVQESQGNNQVNQISYWISAAYLTGLAVAIVSLGFLPCTSLAGAAHTCAS